jgi:8-oxo-dGTP diphosphatase
VGEYVLIYARPVNVGRANSVLVVLKDKPEQQKGRFNLIGGKVDPGETPKVAAIRELKEETGLDPVSAESVTLLGRITGNWGVVYCYRIGVFYNAPSPRPGETEIVSWLDWSELKTSKYLMPNLRVIIPLMMTDTPDWLITDDGESRHLSRHDFSVNVLSVGEGID